MTDINYTLLAFQILNMLLLLGIIALTVYALVRLNRDDLAAGDKIWWTAIIILFPLLGPGAYFLLRPGRLRD
jgi:hypothetical protein